MIFEVKGTIIGLYKTEEFKNKGTGEITEPKNIVQIMQTKSNGEAELMKLTLSLDQHLDLFKKNIGKQTSFDLEPNAWAMSKEKFGLYYTIKSEPKIVA